MKSISVMSEREAVPPLQAPTQAGAFKATRLDRGAGADPLHIAKCVGEDGAAFSGDPG